MYFYVFSAKKLGFCCYKGQKTFFLLRHIGFNRFKKRIDLCSLITQYLFRPNLRHLLKAA
ncbi:MAG: hypothetical protein D8M28_08925 [Proteobacteria bacterium]|nr:hypothetical protein [Pseudomonadota bacterium]